MQLGSEEEMESAVAYQILRQARQYDRERFKANGRENGIPEILRYISENIPQPVLLIFDHFECIPRFISRALSRQIRSMYEQTEEHPGLRKIGVLVAGALSLFELKHEADSAFEVFEWELLPPSNHIDRQAGVAEIIGTEIKANNKVIEWLAEYVGPEPSLLMPLVAEIRRRGKVASVVDSKRLATKLSFLGSRILENIAIHVWQDPHLYEIAQKLTFSDTSVPVYEPAVDIDRYQLLGVVRIENGHYVFRNRMVSQYVRGLLDFMQRCAHPLLPIQIMQLRESRDFPAAMQIASLEAHERALLKVASLTEAKKILTGAWKLLRRGEDPRFTLEGDIENEYLKNQDQNRQESGPPTAAMVASDAARRLKRPAFGWDASHVAVCVPVFVEHACLLVTGSVERFQIQGSFAEAVLLPWFRFIESVKVPLIANWLSTQIASIHFSKPEAKVRSEPVENECDTDDRRETTVTVETEVREASFELLTKVLIELAYQRSSPEEFVRDMIERAELTTGVRIGALRNVDGSADVAIRKLLRWAHFAQTSPDRPTVPIIQRLVVGIVEELGVPQRRLLLAGLMQTGDYESGLYAMVQQYAVPAPAITARVTSAVPLIADFDQSDSELQGFLRPRQEFLDVGFLRSALERSTAVCMVMIPEVQRYGTGVLIRSNVVLTNYHVLQYDNFRPEDVAQNCSVRFGFIGSAAGKSYNLARNPVISSSPANELDFILLRLNESCAESVPLQVSQAQGRHETGAPIHILQHPSGGVMKLSISHNGIVRVITDKGLVQYVTVTAGGSSGSPCFDGNWNLMAIHRAERATSFGSIREGVLLDSIIKEARL